MTAIPHLVSTYFPQPRISPVGEGWRHFGRFREAKSLNYYGTNPGRSSTSGVFERGIGCKSFIKRLRRFGFRVEVRDFWSGDSQSTVGRHGQDEAV